MADSCCGSSCNNSTATDGAGAAPQAPPMQNGYASEYRVTGMDCPSEERMVRMALDGIEPPVVLAFDTPNRRVCVYHEDDAQGATAQTIETRMLALGLGASLEQTRALGGDDIARAQADARLEERGEAAVLKILLLINAMMFALEMSVGWLAQSTGLIADSLDMFADAAVYGVALFAVGRSKHLQLRTAHLSGWLQAVLALGAFAEVIRRFVYGSEPASALMMGIGAVALAANVACLVLVTKKKDSGAHMQASWIFSANDVIANLGVILAGVLVAWTGSRYPDLVIGTIIAAVVLRGAFRILRLKA